MGDGLSNPYRYIEYPILAGGESTLIGVERNGSANNNNMFAVMQWDGAQWVETQMGNALKLKVAASWIDMNTFISHPVMSPDGKVWLIASEFVAPLNQADLDSNILINFYMISLELVTSGDPTDINDWNTTIRSVDFSLNNITKSHESRLGSGLFNTYQDHSRFEFYIPGSGMGKIIAENGNLKYYPIGRSASRVVWTLGENFPKELHSDGLQKTRLCLKLVRSVANNQKLICQGYSMSYELDTRDDSISQILGKNNPAGEIQYSR